MRIQTIKTGTAHVSSAVPDRSTHKNPLAYTGLFQRPGQRITVPVKCFFVSVAGHQFLIDAGWSKDVIWHPIRHLGFGVWFASTPKMRKKEAAARQLKGQKIDGIFLTHMDCDHVSGVKDFDNIPVYAAEEEIRAAKKQRLRYGKAPDGQNYSPIRFADDPQALFGRSADVFGDGSVIAYLTPTHSAGSVLYRINDGDQFALIVGDNGYSEASWDKELLPGPLYDADNMRRCLQWIQKQRKDSHCVGVYCAHDPKDR